MAIKTINDANLTAIADAIRAKGVEGNFTPSQMPDAIARIPTGGGSEIKWARASITPGANDAAIDLSPWINEKNIDDWFLFGGSNCTGSDTSNRYVCSQVRTPIVNQIYPDSGPGSVGYDAYGMPSLVAYYGEKSTTQAPTSKNARFSSSQGWAYRTTWDPATRKLTFPGVDFLAKGPHILIYRVVE